MRSVLALAVLALTGTLDLAAAARCRPSRRTTLTDTTTTSISPTETAATGTTTGTELTSTETGGPRAIKNEVSNGNFAARGGDGDIPFFVIDGEARVVTGQGYKGDGSKESGCAELSASDETSGDEKRDLGLRDLGPFVGISQTIYNMNVMTPYTIRFFYAVVTTSALNVCWIDAYVGTQTFFSTFIFSMGPSIQWATVIEQTSAPSVSGPIGISVTCISGGVATVYIDSIFMSNLVTPATINNAVLDYGGDDETSSSTPPVNGGSTSLSSTTTASATSLISTTSGEQQTSNTLLDSTTGILSTTGLDSTTEQSEVTSTTKASEPTAGMDTTISVPSNRTATSASSNGITSSMNTFTSTFPTESTFNSLFGTTSVPSNGSTTATDAISSTVPTAFDSTSLIDATSLPSNSTMTSSGKTLIGTTSTDSASSGVPTEIDGLGSHGPRDISTAPIGKVCAGLLGTSPITGRGCAMRPHNSAGGYSKFLSSDVSKEQCAALCLADSNCQSFEWNYQGSGCANDCRLIATSLSNQQGNFGPAIWAYDRSCIVQAQCPDYPADSICVNAVGSTPGAGCKQRLGTLKSCAKPFATASVSLVCGATAQCRDVCAQYPSCRSFTTSYSGSNNCFLYEGTVSEISEPGGSTYFSDISCYDCGLNMGYLKYSFFLNDPTLMPEQTCRAPPSTDTTTAHTTTTPVSSTQAPSTIEAPSTTAAPLPGLANPFPISDNDPEPDAPTECWVVGVKKQGWWGRTRDSNSRQNTIEDCAFLCSQEVNCKAFALNTFDDLMGPTCALSSKKLGVDGVNLGVQWSLMWNDLDCFRCDGCDIAGPALPTTAASLSAILSFPLNTTTAAWTTTISPSQTAQTTAQTTDSSDIVTTSATDYDFVTTTTTTSSEFCHATVNKFKPMTNGTNTPPVCTSVQNPSSDILCGHTSYFPWYFDQASFDDFPHQDSGEQCAAICATDPYCIASGWSQSYGRCAMGHHQLIHIVWQQFGTDLITWSDMGCWDCPECLGLPLPPPTSTSTSTTATYNPDQTIDP
ncbi:Fc.00g104970.m01.CDS01 [Cosmosporella sp. VM-42]